MLLSRLLAHFLSPKPPALPERLLRDIGVDPGTTRQRLYMPTLSDGANLDRRLVGVALLRR